MTSKSSKNHAQAHAGRHGALAIAVLAACAVAAPTPAEAIGGGIVSVTHSFSTYTGVVGSGAAFGPGTPEFETYMNDVQIYPAEPEPGLEGYFVPPDPEDPDSHGSGLGRTSVDFGGAGAVSFYTSRYDAASEAWVTDEPNFIGFEPAAPTPILVGDEFLLGTFQVQNGVFWAPNPVHAFRFSMSTISPDPALNGFVYSDVLEHVITPNWADGDPKLVADFFRFAGHLELGSIRVLEKFDGPNWGTVDLYGRIGSLVPTRLANPTGGVFLDPSTEPFPPPDPPGEIPEPGVALLLLLGLGGVAASRGGRTTG